MLRIGEAATACGVSNRTLRHWEAAGLLESHRMDNGYRYFDNKNMMRIKQIMLLRKLRLPIQDIQRIFVTGELSIVLEVLTRHVEETNQQADELKALGVVLKRLIEIVKSKQSLENVFQYLNIPDHAAALELRNALQRILSEREKAMRQHSSYSNNDIRIIHLPKMVVASYSVVSETPEKDCRDMLHTLVLEHALHEKSGFRHFGFGFNDDNKNYGYEMWVVIPDDFEVQEPLIKKVVTPGLYAALPAYLTIIGERWDQLSDWVEDNDTYRLDWRPDDNRHYLEECMDYFTFHGEETSESQKQLDLLYPIAKISKDNQTIEVHRTLEPKRVWLPEIMLGGCTFPQKENTLLWHKKVPWYKLAQNIYQSGKDWMSRTKEGNNTFTLVYGDTSSDTAFYADGKRGKVDQCFAAVEMTKSFESYPGGLEERKLPELEYLVFSTWISPEHVGNIKLKSKELYMAASEYIANHHCKVDPHFCLEREYRKDGKMVDKIELYVPLSHDNEITNSSQ